MNVRFLPAGDCALAVELEGEIGPALAMRLRALEALISGGRVDGIVETVPSFRSLLVYYEPARIGYGALCEAIAANLSAAAEAELPSPRTLEIPCCYRDPELGADLAAVAERLGLTPEEVVAMNTAAEYLVYFIGFAPGQPYLTGLPPRLAIPRLETPRTHTPAGAVGIGGGQCCIYSVESPGGFWILGRTPVPLYDPQRPDPILLQPGDRLRFVSVERDAYDAIAAAVARGDYRPAGA